MVANLVNIFNKMRAVAQAQNIYLRTPKALSFRVSGVDPKQVVIDLDVDSIKEKYGIDLKPSIENDVGYEGTIYLENIDQLFIADPTEFERIISVLANVKPSYSDSDELIFATVDELFEEEEESDISIDDIINGESIGDIVEEEDEEEEEIGEEEHAAKSSKIGSADLEEKVEAAISKSIAGSSFNFCPVSFVINELRDYDKDEIMKVIKSVCDRMGYTLENGMIFM